MRVETRSEPRDGMDILIMVLRGEISVQKPVDFKTEVISKLGSEMKAVLMGLGKVDYINQALGFWSDCQ